MSKGGEEVGETGTGKILEDFVGHGEEVRIYSKQIILSRLIDQIYIFKR